MSALYAVSDLYFLKIASPLNTLSYIDVFDYGLIIAVLFVTLVILLLMIYRLLSERRSAKKLKSEVDATKLEIVEKSEIQKALFQGSIDPIIIFNTKNLIVDYNKSAEDFFGYNFFKLIGKEFSANESFNHKFPEWLKLFKKGEGISGYNTFVNLNSGKAVPVSISISPIYDINKELANLFFWYRDVSKDYEFQRALQQSEESYRKLFENVNDAILVLRKSDRRIIDANNLAFELYGYKYLELINSTLAILSVSVFDEYKLLDEIIGGQKKTVESIHKKKDGTEIHIELNASVLNYKGEDVIILVTRDITDRKNFEAKLQKNIKEKEILLREVHHRVKNNMQLITSLLDLQISNTNEEETKKNILESQNRIRVMSIVYERLYESVDLHTINTQQFVQNITNYLYQVYNGAKKNIHVNYSIDDFEIDIETAVPVSLIICELVTNSLKYAFPESSFSNTIDIEYKRHTTTSVIKYPYSVTVKDNGGSFPSDLNPASSNSLGLQLVHILARQLKGTIRYNFNNGTEFKIEFKGA
ncbi:MAG TPA: PAS domain S-box protein [Ignavibacteriaceae bacterium]|nr:PAS domain S-box protein [Ignavibacteriaceae bacterium]